MIVMNCKKLLSVVVVFLTIPLVTHGMQLTKKVLVQKMVQQKSYCKSNQELRNIIAGSFFYSLQMLEDVKKIEKHAVCDKGCFVEDIVYKATQYRENESRYAELIKQLYMNNWKLEHCTATILHTAVISDLPRVSHALLTCNDMLVKEQDLNGCIPLHYVQSGEVAKLLLKNGSDIGAKDKWGNTPLHMASGHLVPLFIEHKADPLDKNLLYLRIPGLDWKILAPSYNALDFGHVSAGWHRITPLHDAVDRGDLEKLQALLRAIESNDCIVNDFISYERMVRVLLSLAHLRHWRTNDSVFLACHNVMLSSLKKQRCSYEESRS
jgi:Ankyrin repeats (3 copies)